MKENELNGGFLWLCLCSNILVRNVCHRTAREFCIEVAREAQDKLMKQNTFPGELLGGNTR